MKTSTINYLIVEAGNIKEQLVELEDKYMNFDCQFSDFGAEDEHMYLSEVYNDLQQMIYLQGDEAIENFHKQVYGK